MRLSSVDLPAFGGPAIATTRPSRSRSPRAAPASASAISSRSSARDRQRRPDQILRHIGLVGKIDPRLDQRQRLDQPRPPGLGAIAEQALELAIGLTALRLGLGADQIGETLDRGEIEPAVLERAARELARLRRPQSFDPPERAEHRGDHRAAAVQLQLGDVLAGLAVRPGKPQRQRLVDRFAAVRIAHAGERGLARLRQLPVSAFSASPARGPEMRTTAIAAGGRPEDRAKMVSRARAGIARTEAPRARRGQDPIGKGRSVPLRCLVPTRGRPCGGDGFSACSRARALLGLARRNRSSGRCR